MEGPISHCVVSARGCSFSGKNDAQGMPKSLGCQLVCITIKYLSFAPVYGFRNSVFHDGYFGLRSQSTRHLMRDHLYCYYKNRALVF